MIKILTMRTRPGTVVLSWIALLCCFGMTATEEQLLCYLRESSDDGNNPKAIQKEPVIQACNNSEKSCFMVFSNKTGVPVEKVMGCWPHSHNGVNDQLSCEDRECMPSNGVFFCCCGESYCNRMANMDNAPILWSEKTTPREESKEPMPSNIQYSTMIMSLVPVIAITFIVILAFWLYRRHKFPHEPLATQDPNPHCNTTAPVEGLRPVQLKEIKASGRFGCVWKAQMLNETVAVKIFPLQEIKSFAKECDIYNMPSLNHNSSILRFIGAEKRGDNLNMELWLISEFHERGSLFDYLKRHLLTWSEALHMATTMVNGLAFLHDIMPANGTNGPKEAIAHRDFKSKNVLVKNDLSACIADFGLAVKFQTGKTDNVIQGQVGTRRYMSPEVLEGSVNFSVEFFFRIDMYACGLVLWEILSRCSATEGPIEDYQLPFEKEVGLRPTLEEMQDVVIHQVKRPELKEAWLKDPALYEYCCMVEECWDTDADARLSACCVMERLTAMQKRANFPSSVSPLQAPPVMSSAPPSRPPRMTYLPPPPHELSSSSSTSAATCSSTSTQDSGITLGPPTTSASLVPHINTPVIMGGRGDQVTVTPPLSIMVPVAVGPTPQTAITSIYPPPSYNTIHSNQGNHVTTTIASSIPPQAV